MPHLTIRGSTSEVEEYDIFESMRRLWQAMRSGDETACLIWDRPNPAAISVSTLVRHIKRHEAVLASEGLELAPPVYAPGAVVLNVEDKGFKTDRLPWDMSMEVSEQLQILWRVIRREERHVAEVELGQISMLDDGAISWGEGPYFLERPALGQLLKISGKFGSGVSYVAGASPDLRAQNWRSKISKDLHRKVKLRLRRNPLTGRFSVFAVVTPKYGVLDIDDLAVCLADSLPENGMRGQVFYDSNRSHLRIDGHWEQEYIINKAAGDVFRAGIQIRTNDTGNGGIWVLPTAMRQLTRAQVLLADASNKKRHESLFSAIHQGNMGRISTGIIKSLEKSGDAFADFEIKWRKTRSTPFSAKMFGTDSSPEKVFTYLAKEFLWEVFGYSGTEELVSQLINNLGIESADSVADILNAIGRLHSLPSLDQYKRERLEAKVYDILSWYTGR